MLQNLTGTFRFDVIGERDRTLARRVKKGDVTVSRGNVKADSVMRADRKVFDAIAAAR